MTEERSDVSATKEAPALPLPLRLTSSAREGGRAVREGVCGRGLDGTVVGAERLLWRGVPYWYRLVVA